MSDWSKAVSSFAPDASGPHDNRGLDIDELLLFEQGEDGTQRRRSSRAGAGRGPARRSAARGRDRPAGPFRAAGDPPFHAALAKKLRHRHRALSVGLVHHEAQSAPQREARAASRFRRHPSAAAHLDGAGRAPTHRPARALAQGPDRNAGGGDAARGGRAWRAVRHDVHHRRARRARRAQEARARAGIGARHQSRHGGHLRLRGRCHCGQRARARRSCGVEAKTRARRRGHHADQSQHVRPVRGRDGGDRGRGA